MTSIRHPWPFALVLASLCMISCNAGNKTQSDAGSKDAAVSDTGTDADTDGDNDAGHDAGCGVGLCIYGGVTSCTSNGDCAGIESNCACGKLFGADQIMNFCYQKCSKFCPCFPSDLTCVNPNNDADAGICLANAYNEYTWKGKFVPQGVAISNDDMIKNRLILEVGTINITFTMSVILGNTDPDHGSLIVITYIAQSATSQFQLQVMVPSDLFKAGNTVNFADCQAKGLTCNAVMIENIISGTTISQTFVRAINITDQTGKYENWVKIDTENLSQGQTSTGSWKLFFGEYNAEISVN